MRIVQITTPGGPEALELVDRPMPEPGRDAIRVRAEAIGVGRADVLVRRGTYKWMPPLPAIPGSEMVGTVDALGPGAPADLLGRRVLVSARELPERGGGYAEAICIPADAAFLLPDGIDPFDAASLPNLQLALALFDSVGSRAPTSVLIPGAAGAVGAMLTSVARSQGLQVIGTASSDAKRAYARANGVDQLVDSDPATLADAVRAVTGGRGVDIAFDHVGAASIIACLHALAPLGTVLSYNIVQGPPASDVFQAMRKLLDRSLAVRTFSMHTFDADSNTRRALMQQAIDGLAQGRFTVPAALRLPLDQVREAHRLLDDRAHVGKIVLVP